MWGKWGCRVYSFYDLQFRIYDDGFRSQQKIQLLSGDGWAVFEVLLHGEPLEERFKV